MGGERIKLRILIPLTVAIVGLIGAFVAGAFRLKQNALDAQVNQYLGSVRKILRSKHHSEVESMGKILDNLQSNKPLSLAWSNGDQSAFLATLRHVFSELCRSYDIIGIHYYDRIGSAFAECNERTAGFRSFQHSTVTKALKNGDSFFGMELSDAGSFFLSYTAPWKVDGQIVGFIELEKELKHITGDVPAAFGIDLVTFIDKNYIDRELWEKIYWRQHPEVAWHSYADFVLVDNTFNHSPPSIEHQLSLASQGNIGIKSELASQGHEYSVALFPLIDAKNRTVGYTAVFYDATRYLRETRDLLYLISALCIAIGIALFVSFYKMLDSLEQELVESHRKMVDESQLRLEVERRHTKELAAHVLELEMARTRALNMAREAELARTSAEQARQRLRDSQSQTPR